MGARESIEMVAARSLVTESGFTAYAAANKTGLTKAAIYNAPWYKKWKEKRRAKSLSTSR